MVTFKLATKQSQEVIVNGKTFGYILKERGFTIGPSTIKDFIADITAEDFRTITQRIEDIRSGKRSVLDP